MIVIAYLDAAFFLVMAMLLGYSFAHRHAIIEWITRTRFGRWMGMDEDLVYPLPHLDQTPPQPRPTIQRPASSTVKVLPRRPWDHAVDG